ncbi:MAG: SHOCT domain-containing protein [Acidimicrobiales bacterium]
MALFACTAGAVACLVLLYEGMRSVMEVGGSCASGGPYVSAQPCPKGVGWIIPLAIWVGIGCVAGASVAALKLAMPSIAWLAWPALFMSLGWNFFRFAIDPAGPATGPVWSWLFCGAMFWAMGLAPVALWLLHPEDRPGASRPVGRMGPAVQRASRLGAEVRAQTTPPPFRTPAPESAERLVDALERLEALHQRGAIDDDEYRAAKQRAIEEGPS